MKRLLPADSMEKPRPPSAGFHHQPVCGGCGLHTRVPGTVTALRLMPSLIIAVELAP